MISPKYTKVGESFRKNVPHEMQCSMFCGGKRCKYEIPDNWKKEQMAIKASDIDVYSSIGIRN